MKTICSAKMDGLAITIIRKKDDSIIMRVKYDGEKLREDVCGCAEDAIVGMSSLLAEQGDLNGY